MTSVQFLFSFKARGFFILTLLQSLFRNKAYQFVFNRIQPVILDCLNAGFIFCTSYLRSNVKSFHRINIIPVWGFVYIDSFSSNLHIE